MLAGLKGDKHSSLIDVKKGAMTLSTMTLSITILGKNNTQHNNALPLC
jgi:hypothetical protein